MIKIAVSSGDPAGVGPDICIKAFGQKKSYNFVPVIFGDQDILKSRANRLGIKANIQTYKENAELSNEALWVVDQPCGTSITPGKPDPDCANFTISIFDI